MGARRLFAEREVIRCMSLTAKQALFVKEYLIDLNATQAAIRAGYSAKTAQVIGAENLSKPIIKTAIDKAIAERSERTQIDADWLLTRLADEAEADLADIYFESGALKPVHMWPKIWRQGLIAGIKTRQEKVHGGDDDEFADITEVKLADRNSIKKMIGDHIGVQAFKQQIEHSGNVTVDSLIDELTGGSTK